MDESRSNFSKSTKINPRLEKKCSNLGNKYTMKKENKKALINNKMANNIEVFDFTDPN